MATCTCGAIKRTTIVVFDITICCSVPREELTAADLHLPDDALPTRKVADPLRSRLFDPKLLRDLERIARMARRRPLRNGFPVGSTKAATSHRSGRTGMPQEFADDTIADLRCYKREFDACRDAICGDFERNLRRWYAANGAWGDVIRQAVERSGLDAETLRRRLSFDFSYEEVSAYAPASDDTGESQQPAGIKSAADGIFHMVAQQAKKVWRCYVLSELAKVPGERKVHHLAIKALRKWQSKLLAFGLIHPDVMALSHRIKAVTDLLPANGSADGQHYDQVSAIMLLLAELDGDLVEKVCPAPTTDTGLTEVFAIPQELFVPEAATPTVDGTDQIPALKPTGTESSEVFF